MSISRNLDCELEAELDPEVESAPRMATRLPFTFGGVTAPQAPAAQPGAPNARPKLCGTFGCTLPDRHNGLHLLPSGGAAPRQRRAPAVMEAILGGQTHVMTHVTMVEERQKLAPARGPPARGGEGGGKLEGEGEGKGEAEGEVEVEVEGEVRPKRRWTKQGWAYPRSRGTLGGSRERLGVAAVREKPVRRHRKAVVAVGCTPPKSRAPPRGVQILSQVASGGCRWTDEEDEDEEDDEEEDEGNDEGEEIGDDEDEDGREVEVAAALLYDVHRRCPAAESGMMIPAGVPEFEMWTASRRLLDTYRRRRVPSPDRGDDDRSPTRLGLQGRGPLSPGREATVMSMVMANQPRHDAAEASPAQHSPPGHPAPGGTRLASGCAAGGEAQGGRGEGGRGEGRAKRRHPYRCGSCTGCVRGECGECKNCLDKPKNGGSDIKKKACARRVCYHPRESQADPIEADAHTPSNPPPPSTTGGSVALWSNFTAGGTAEKSDQRTWHAGSVLTRGFGGLRGVHGRGLLWTREEDLKVLDGVQRHGHSWSKIARDLSEPRTDDAVRNRWHRLVSTTSTHRSVTKPSLATDPSVTRHGLVTEPHPSLVRLTDPPNSLSPSAVAAESVPTVRVAAQRLANLKSKRSRHPDPGPSSNPNPNPILLEYITPTLSLALNRAGQWSGRRRGCR